MQEIYVSHSTSFDFKKELYEPLKEFSKEKSVTFILPHEGETFINSKEIIKNAKLVIAEVSLPSTGQGVELGWANLFGKEIFCFYKKGFKPSSSLREVTSSIFEYESSDSLIQQIQKLLEERSS